MNRCFRRGASAWLWAALFAGLGFAQTYTGGVRGTVKDVSGLAINGAAVTLKDQNSGVERKTTTDDAGLYVFSATQPSTYTVTVQATGFANFQQTGVIVDAQQFVTIDASLNVGTVTQSVAVTAEAPLIDTSDANTGQTVSEHQLQDLPNLGRVAALEAIKVTPEVTNGSDPKFFRAEDQDGTAAVSIQGGPVQGNNYLIDGISITDSTNRAVIAPSIEGVQEVKLQVSTYDAEVGRTGGGTFNEVLKSGTNQLHGSLFGEQWLQGSLANDFFNNQAGLPVANQPFKTWAGSLGGPIVIPKVYNGRNRTFFFASIEGYEQSSTVSQPVSVPSAAEVSGDFSHSYVSPGGPLQVIYNPLAPLVPDPNNPGQMIRQPFPNNIIPKSMINPVGAAIASYFPAPQNTPTYYGAPDFTGDQNNTDKSRVFTGKIDEQITSWWRVGAWYMHNYSNEPGVTFFGGVADPGAAGFFGRKVDATSVNTTLTPGGRWVFTARWGFNRFPNLTGAPAQYDFNQSKLGFPASYVAALPQDTFPGINTLDAFSGLGTTLGGRQLDTYYSRSFSTSASTVFGRHSVKFGFDFRAIHADGNPGGDPGSYNFDQTFTSATPTNNNGSGSGLADLLLGFPTSGEVTNSLYVKNMVKYYGFWVQDDFRVTSKLTVNMGIRFEHETGVETSNNSLLEFNPTAPNPMLSGITGVNTNGVFTFAGQNGASGSATSPTPLKVGPRIGFAYAANHKTVIRGGFGIFWLPYFFDVANPPGFVQSTPYVASINNGLTPANSLSNPFPNGIQQPLGTAVAPQIGLGAQTVSGIYDQNAKSSYMYQYSIDVQRELGHGFVVSTGYAGSEVKHLIQGTPAININQVPDQYLSLGNALNNSVPNPFYGTPAGILNLASPTVAQSQLLRPFPAFGNINVSGSDDNKSEYNSWHVKVEKRVTSGLTLLSSVTWSHSMNESNGLPFGTAGNQIQFQSPYRQDNYSTAGEWAPSTIDIPWYWIASVNYQLPFGRRQAFLSGSGKFLDALVGGWSINTQIIMHDGFPLPINQTNLNSAIGTSNQRPNQVSGVALSTGGSPEDHVAQVNGGGDPYINPAAFTQAAAFSYGDTPRTLNNLRGPGQANTDLSLFKSFSFFERLRAQFRAEVFNLTNTPYFSFPLGTSGTRIGSPTFGLLSTQRNFPRVIQLGIKFNF